MWINVMNWFDKIISGDIEKQPRYSIYSLRSKVYIHKGRLSGIFRTGINAVFAPTMFRRLVV
ncbi:hypothetical protein CoNPh26_CDS0010 [Staphylococcus phage S-CoN_Ph26]|nr:hypothetical protein CoNPh26_CDS0010 [Staphylococcus phage S-CoN_Ph26]